MKKLLVLTTTLLAFSNSYAGSDYYLDATNGNNAWSGTNPYYLGNCNPTCTGPWKTMDAVENFSDASPTVGFEPGDRILFNKSDTFVATTGLTFEDSGTQENPIVFTSYGQGDQPILKMSGWPLVDYLWSDTGNGIWFHAYAGQAVVGFWEDDVHIEHASDSGLTDGRFFWDEGNGIYYRPPAGTTPGDHELYRTGAAYGIAINNLKHLEFNDLHFKTGPHAIGGSAIDSSIENILIENCQFNNMTAPIFINSRNGNPNSNITVRNNTFDSQRRAVVIQSMGNGPEQNYNINITGNTISNMDIDGYYYSFLIYSGYSVDHEAISGQNFMNSNISDNKVFNGGTSVGVSLWTHEAALFHNNIIAKNDISDTAVGITLFSSNTADAHTGNRVFQNLIYDCNHTDEMASSSLVGAMRLSGSDSSESNVVFNNTIANCGTSFYLFPGEGFTLHNNISLNPIDRHIWYYGNVTADPVNKINNNLYYSSTLSYGFRLGGSAGEEVTFAQWQSDSSQDSKSLIADPLVNAESSNDFHLTATSPAIDAGVNMGAITDLDDTPITKFPDIGAYEY